MVTRPDQSGLGVPRERFAVVMILVPGGGYGNGEAQVPLTMAEYWGEPFARTYMELEDHHPALRTARGLLAGWEEMPVEVDAGDPFLGHPWKPSVVSYHYGGGIGLDSGLSRRWEGDLEPREGGRLKEIREYFDGRTTRDLIKRRLRSERMDPEENGEDAAYWAGGWGGHTLLDYERLLTRGVSGLQDAIRDRMAASADPAQRAWYEAVLVAGDALVAMAHRFARAAEGEARRRAGEEGERLREMAAICRRVPENPARTLREALQSFWLAFLFDGVDSPGRFDQYMHPYYRRDIERGRLSGEEARGLLEALWIRFEEVRAWNLCIGGQTVEGEDATNELTWVILDIAQKYRFRAPNLTLRWHPDLPKRIREKAVEVMGTGIGMPALYNDEVVIPALEGIGIPAEDARNYAMNGCNQIDIQGLSHMGLEDGELNLLKCLELALHNGRCPLSGRRIGPESGDPRGWETFGELMDAYRVQVSHMTDRLTSVANISQEVYAEHSPDPFRSLLVGDCIEEGQDFKCGGPRYNHGQILTQGIANTADALAALKKLVFEEGRFTMDDVLGAMARDWEDHEDLRRVLIRDAPKYGNDIGYADRLAARAVEYFFRELRKHRTHRGGTYTGGSSVFVRGPMFGSRVGATPDGRRAGETLADSVGPVQGRDRRGPTSVLRSASRVDQRLAGSGYVLNIKFDGGLFSGPGDRKKQGQLLETYLQLGGQQVQVNVVNVEDLRAARENPEEYSNLVVRVGGFSEYFVRLDETLQEEIISRTTHT